ncbi:MAG: hypothetical protein ACJ76X_10335 [Solirubrobacteraceae bacterium]
MIVRGARPDRDPLVRDRNGQLGARERDGDRTVGLAVGHQSDVAAGDLDAVGFFDDCTFPADDAVALGVDRGEAHPVDGELGGVVADEPAAAARAEAVGVAAAAGEVGTAPDDPDGGAGRRADPEETLQVGAHRDRVRDQVRAARGGGAGEVAAAAVAEDRAATAGRSVQCFRQPLRALGAVDVEPEARGWGR